VYRVGQKVDHQHFTRNFVKYWPIFKFFHYHILQEICNKVINSSSSSSSSTCERTAGRLTGGYSDDTRSSTAGLMTSINSTKLSISFVLSTSSDLPDVEIDLESFLRDASAVFTIPTHDRSTRRSPSDQPLVISISENWSSISTSSSARSTLLCSAFNHKLN